MRESEIGEFTHAPEFAGRVEKLIGIASKCRSVFDLNEPIYREFLVTYPPWSVNFILEMIPCALAFCKASKGDAEQALIGACNLGRDADTITSLVGEIMGSLHGCDAFPKDWRDKVEKQNPQPDMAQMAEDLCGIVKERAETDQKRAADLLSMLS